MLKKIVAWTILAAFSMVAVSVLLAVGPIVVVGLFGFAVIVAVGWALEVVTGRF